MPTQIDKLKAQLLASGLQQKNPAQYQVINQLIGALQSTTTVVNNFIASGSGGGGGNLIADYLTASDQSFGLPNSRQLLAGARIAFDDSVANQRTVNVDAPTYYEWSVLTNGDPVNPELIFAGGDVVMIRVP